MRKTRLAVTSAAALTAALFGAVLTAQPASAADTNCVNGDFCVWEHDDFRGRAWTWAGNDVNYTNDVNDGMRANDNASSYRNRGVVSGSSPTAVRFYENTEGEHLGRSGCVTRGDEDSDLTNNGWDNRISAHKWVQAC